MKQRIISAIIMLIIFIPITIIGKIPFSIMFILIGLLSLKELLGLEKNIPLFMKIFTYLFTIFLIFSNYKNNCVLETINYKYIIGACLFYFSAVVIMGNVKKYNYKDAIYLIMSSLFISVVFNGFIAVRNLGMMQLFYLFLIATLTDTFAFFVGKLFGKNKISPNLSPNKTIEGSVAGSVIGTILTCIIYMGIMGNWSNYLSLIGITLILSVMGQIGDLFFSSIKRYYEVKDFSNLIPGHGGILDRLDSVIFILITYIFILI